MSTVHFLHVGKTGGSAVKRALRTGKVAYWHERNAHKFTATPYGKIHLHHHSMRIDQVPEGDYLFFFLRDPVARFISGFNSRLTKGQPRYYFEWTPSEREAFEAFPTAQGLATALASSDDAQREAAEKAMKSIRHLRFMTRNVGTPRKLRKHRKQIVYIGRQETLDRDWVQMREIFGLPADLELPSDPVTAHRSQRPAGATELDDAAVAALRRWYARDYELLDFCEDIRRREGWAPGEPRRGWRALLSRHA